MRACRGDELPRSVEPHSFVPQGSKVTEIAARAATEIEDRVWWVALNGLKECRVILADIVVLCAVPELSCEPIVISDRRLAEAPDLFWTIRPAATAHRPSIFPIFAGAWLHFHPNMLRPP
jgi:hypothetical protein